MLTRDLVPSHALLTSDARGMDAEPDLCRGQRYPKPQRIADLVMALVEKEALAAWQAFLGEHSSKTWVTFW